MTHYAGIPQASVPARYFGPVPGLLAKNGIDPLSIFQAAGLSAAQLADPEGQLTVEELERLVAAIQSVDCGHEIALQLGSNIHLRDHNVVGFAVISSPTIDYGLRLVMRFFRLIFPAFHMRYRVNTDTAEIAYSPTLPMSPQCLAFHIEVVAAATHRAIEELYQGTLPVYSMELSINPPAHVALYRQHMPQAQIQFDALPHPGLRMYLPASLVSSEPAMANRETLDVAEQRCRILVEQIVSARNIGEWTRMMLRESADGLPSIEELANTLNISTRTLHRYLKREGFIYRSLCVEERERRARELLSQTQFSITRIAQELGYSDASNFARAFRSTVGCGPSEYRTRTQD